MLLALVGLFVLAQSSDNPASATLIPELTDHRRVMDCMSPLARERIDLQVPVLCSVDARGRARDCTVSVNEPTPKVRRASICLAQAYTVRASDGTDPAGRLVTIPVNIRMNVETPPQEALPPHLRSQH